MPRLVASIVQGSNDAFVEATIVTQLSSLSRTAWVINLISFQTPGLPNAGADIEMCLSRGTKTAMPQLTDRDVIYKLKREVKFTTSGAQYQNVMEHFSPAQDIFIVEENIYLQMDSAGTSASNTGYVAVDVTPKQISEAQRLAILAGRIAS